MGKTVHKLYLLYVSNEENNLAMKAWHGLYSGNSQPKKSVFVARWVRETE